VLRLSKRAHKSVPLRAFDEGGKRGRMGVLYRRCRRMRVSRDRRQGRRYWRSANRDLPFETCHSRPATKPTGDEGIARSTILAGGCRIRYTSSRRTRRRSVWSGTRSASGTRSGPYAVCIRLYRPILCMLDVVVLRAYG